MVCTMKIDEKYAFPSIQRFFVLIFCEIENQSTYQVDVFVCHLMAIDLSQAVLFFGSRTTNFENYDGGATN